MNLKLVNILSTHWLLTGTEEELPHTGHEWVAVAVICVFLIGYWGISNWTPGRVIFVTSTGVIGALTCNFVSLFRWDLPDFCTQVDNKIWVLCILWRKINLIVDVVCNFIYPVDLKVDLSWIYWQTWVPFSSEKDILRLKIIDLVAIRNEKHRLVKTKFWYMYF